LTSSIVEGETRCKRVRVRSGSPGRMRKRKKFRTRTNRSVPTACSSFPPT
jgi:hypothetical protein